MFDNRRSEAQSGSAAVRPPLDASTVRAWIGVLNGDLPGSDDGMRVDLIRALEDLKSAASATQARVSVDLDASQRAAQRAAGMPDELLGRGVGTQVALARRESPHAGGRYLGLAKALVHELPHTLVALASGVLSEWRATVLVRESACLTVADRAVFDAEIAADPKKLDGMGTRALEARAREIAQRLDAAAMVARARRAATERCVTIRPAPDTMTYLTALLPVAQGVAAYAALTRAAESARAGGDPRSRGQVMADELVGRIATDTADGVAGTGASAGPSAGAPRNRPSTRLEVQLVMTDRTLLAGHGEPARIPGYGTVPGQWARDLVRDALHTGDHNPATGPLGPLGPVQVWVRRLFTHPATGQLVAMDSRSRLAPPGLASLIRTRDQSCRTPYCDAPARHIDHVVPHAEDGPTAATNLQGKCESCNHTKQAPGWQETTAPPAGEHPRRPEPAIAPDVVTTTPTGHRYVSRAPALPGAPPTIALSTRSSSHPPGSAPEVASPVPPSRAGSADRAAADAA